MAAIVHSFDTKDTKLMRARIAIVGAGAAGLMAAEVLAQHHHRVCVYDAMPSPGRKWLQAGRGGLNITHSAPFEQFMSVYGQATSWLTPIVAAFDSSAIRAWMLDLGIASFIGSSGRIFPQDKKAAPLLRAWLTRLKHQGVTFHMRHRLINWQDNRLTLDTPQGLCMVETDVIIFALGGASWPHLGSDGAWFSLFQRKHIDLTAFQPANCSFRVAWSDYLIHQFAGTPIKPVVLKFQTAHGWVEQQGELMLSATGLEGSLIYQHAAVLRSCIEQAGNCIIWLDFLPHLSQEKVLQRWYKTNRRHSLTRRLHQELSLSPVVSALVQEYMRSSQLPLTDDELCALLKHYPINLLATGSLSEAISTAGGVALKAMNDQLMLTKYPGVFCAGEMLDWEAPTGGYLLTASLATGRWAAYGAIAWLQRSLCAQH